MQTPAASAPRVESLSATKREWIGWGLLVGGIAIYFLVLLNPYWVPSGDGDLYVAIARSLALGEGFRFNGQQVNICPPGWPLVLAGMMKISPTFLAFKLLLILCQTLQLGMWYWILKRFVVTPMAVMAVVLTAILNHVYSLTFWTHSEALYCVFSTASLLIGLQIAENRGGLIWRVPLLLGLCFACASVRWAALLQIVLLAGILLHGLTPWKLKQPAVLRSGLILIACFAVLAVTFSGFRQYLKLTRAQEIAATEAGAVFEESQVPAQATVESQTVQLVNVTAPRNATVVEELWRRVAESGRWISWLFWQPFRFSASVPRLAWVDIAFGWVAMAVLVVTLIHGIARRQWLWLAGAAYCGALMINWPNANARYLVPIAPLLLAGIMGGIDQFLQPWRITRRAEARIILVLILLAGLLAAVNGLTGLNARLGIFPKLPQLEFGATPFWALGVVLAARFLITAQTDAFILRAAKVWGIVFIASVFAVNLTLYCIDVKVARSTKFYHRYEAGFNRQLISACFYLNEIGLKDGELAVSERYQNLGRVKKSKYAIRAANLLTNRVILSVPDKYAGTPRTPLLKWLYGRKSVAYYLDQRPNIPWRVWHFVLPRELNEKLVGGELGPDSSGWKLYKLRYEQVPSTQPVTQPASQPAATQPGFELRRYGDPVEVPEKRNWPTRVVGL